MSFRVTTNSSQASPRFCQSAMSQIRFRIWRAVIAPQRSKSCNVKSCQIMSYVHTSMAANKLDGLEIPASRGSCDLERKSKAASTVRPTLVQHSPTWLILFSSVQFCSVLTSSDQFSFHCFLQNLLINMRLPSENVSLNTCWLPEDSVVPADKKHQMYQNARHTVHSKYSNILNLGLPAIGHCHWWAEQSGAGRRVATNLRGHSFSTLPRDCAVRENAWPSWWQTVSNGSGKLAANLKDQWSQPEQPGRGSPSA